MSTRKVFLKELRRLMEHVPQDLTLEQLEWAFEETSLILGSLLAARNAAAQRKKPIPGSKHTEKGPPR